MTAETTEPSTARQVRVSPRQVQAAKIAIKADAKLGRTPSASIQRIAQAKRK